MLLIAASACTVRLQQEWQARCASLRVPATNKTRARHEVDLSCWFSNSVVQEQWAVQMCGLWWSQPWHRASAFMPLAVADSREGRAEPR